MKDTDNYNFDLFPDGWEDSCLVSELKKNRDGSVTVRIQIDVNDDLGNMW